MCTLGLAAWASWSPCQAEALNERSSMPPVSVTMQALKPDLADGAAAALVEELVALEVEELLAFSAVPPPQAVAARATTASPVTTRRVVGTSSSPLRA